METERILMYQREDTEDYGNIDTDRTVQGFKASLRVLLADERLRHRKSFNQSGFLGTEGGLGHWIRPILRGSIWPNGVKLGWNA